MNKRRMLKGFLFATCALALAACGGVSSSSVPIAVSAAAVASPAVFVSNTGANDVVAFAARGNDPVRTIASGIKGPGPLALDGLGHLYVANLAAKTVGVYDTADGSLKRTIAPKLGAIASIAVSNDGELAVALGAGKVITYSEEGRPIRTIADSYGPSSVAFDSHDNLFFTDSRGVLMYSPGYASPVWSAAVPGTPTLVAVYGTNGVAVAFRKPNERAASAIQIADLLNPLYQQIAGLHDVCGMTTDARNNFYVCDNAGGGSNVGIYTLGAEKPARTIVHGIDQPLAIAVTPAGTLFVVNRNEIVTEYRSDGLRERNLGQGLDAPIAIAVTAGA